MKLERPRPAILQVTLSIHEMATLIAAARWTLEGRPGELAPEALAQLAQVVTSYDEAAARLREG